MIQTTEFRKGLKIEIDGKPYVILETQFVNPGKGSAFFKVRMKNLENSAVVERTYKSGVDTGIERPDLEEVDMEYLYHDNDGYHFMNQTTFETVNLHEDYVGDAKYYLQEGIKLKILYHKGRPISLDLPYFVNLRVTETDPGLKGDTAAGGMKKGKMETGLQTNIPLFIKQGELLKIDTRTGEYVERVKE